MPCPPDLCYLAATVACFSVIRVELGDGKVALLLLSTHPSIQISPVALRAGVFTSRAGPAARDIFRDTGPKPVQLVGKNTSMLLSDAILPAVLRSTACKAQTLPLPYH